MLYDVLGGTASWFVAALIVCEILFLHFYKLFRNEYILLICGLSLPNFGHLSENVDPAPLFWYYKEAFRQSDILVLFGIYLEPALQRDSENFVRVRSSLLWPLLRFI